MRMTSLTKLYRLIICGTLYTNYISIKLGRKRNNTGRWNATFTAFSEKKKEQNDIDEEEKEGKKEEEEKICIILGHYK